MADFVSVIQRAVDNLSDKSESSRHALYEKAEAALLGQLRAMDPPLAPDVLDQQAKTLKEAIKQVEAGFAEPAKAPAMPAAEPTLGQERAARPDPLAAGGEGRGNLGKMILWLVVFAIIGGAAGAAWWKRAELTEMASGLVGSMQEAAKVDDGNKDEERVPRADEPATPVREVTPDPEKPAEETETAEAPTAQQPAAEQPSRAEALLLEEAKGGGAPQAAGASIVWQFRTDSTASGSAPEYIEATVNVPDRQMSLLMTIRKNVDPLLPASHTIELLFSFQEGSPIGEIKTIPGFLTKGDAKGTGTPLSGAVALITQNFFLMGLSDNEADRSQNVEELRSRNFIDIPVVYANDSPAVLSLSKGEGGTEVFKQAFTAWDG